jgi:effector-binding domain-containing protein
MTVAFISVTGHYSQIPTAFGKLYGWVAQRGFKPVGPAIAVYHNIPGQVPDDQLHWELRTQISGDIAEVDPDAEGLGVNKFGAVKMATTVYKGPYEDMQPTYAALLTWVMNNGYETSGPPEELYLNDPTKTPAEEPLTEIRFPVRKK